MSKTTENIDGLGTATVRPPHLTTDHGPIVRQSIDFDEPITINGVDYEGPIYLEAYVGRANGRTIVDCGSLKRSGMIGGWGLITDSARSKINAAVADRLTPLVELAADDEWIKAQVEEEVRLRVSYAARRAYLDAYRPAREYHRDDIDYNGIALDVLLNLTEEDLTHY